MDFISALFSNLKSFNVCHVYIAIACVVAIMYPALTYALQIRQGSPLSTLARRVVWGATVFISVFVLTVGGLCVSDTVNASDDIGYRRSYASPRQILVLDKVRIDGEINSSSQLATK